MDLNDFLAAVAARLAELWPERNIYVNEIPRHADGQLYVGIIESNQRQHLDRRRKRRIQLEVLYFRNDKDKLDFNDWSETMYDNFETLEVLETAGKTRLIKLTDQQARPDDNARVWQFLCDADFYFVLAPEDIPTMAELAQTEEIK